MTTYVPTAFIISNSASGKVLTVSNEVEGVVITGEELGVVVQLSLRYVGHGLRTRAPDQSWELVPVGQNTGIFKIVSVATRKVLDVQGASTADGAVIQLYDDNGGANQHWRLELMGDGGPTGPGWAFSIISVHSGKVLDVPLDQIGDDSALIQQYTLNGGQNQLWNLAVVSWNV